MLFAELLLFSHKVAILDLIFHTTDGVQVTANSFCILYTPLQVSCLDERMILKNAFAGDRYCAPIGYKTTNTVYRDSM
jgi:hypothetical protein